MKLHHQAFLVNAFDPSTTLDCIDLQKISTALLCQWICPRKRVIRDNGNFSRLCKVVGWHWVSPNNERKLK